MPADHAYDAVHELTVGGEKYGCNNDKPRLRGYWAVGRRYFPDGSFELVSVRVPDHMSKGCRYDLADTDPKCAGCPREKDTAYLERMRGMK